MITEKRLLLVVTTTAELQTILSLEFKFSRKLMNNHEDRGKILIIFFSFMSRIIDSENKKTCLQAKRRAKFLEFKVT